MKKKITIHDVDGSIEKIYSSVMDIRLGIVQNVEDYNKLVDLEDRLRNSPNDFFVSNKLGISGDLLKEIIELGIKQKYIDLEKAMKARTEFLYNKLLTKY